jgi:UDP-3-O-[3-hydroxymyristoyl] glucosamine N-acyltransferase
MAAQVGVAGSTKIGKFNMVGGQVGFAGHITVGDKNGIGAQTGVDNSIGSNGKWLGAPVQPAMEFARQTVYLKRLGEMYSDIKDLKKRIKE